MTKDSTQAVNSSQLFGVFSVLGGSFDGKGVYTGPTFIIGSKETTNLPDTFTNIDNNLTTLGDNITNISKGGVSEIRR